MSFTNVSPGDISHEEEIVWLEDVSSLRYVREHLYMVPRRRGKPGHATGSNERMVGYANLDKDAECTNGRSERRVFTFRDYDPYGEHSNQMPTEAVDPKTVAPKVPGQKPKEPAMTNSDIFTQILSEASGKPKEEVAEMTESLVKMLGSRTRLGEEIPDDKAQELLAALRKELPGIRKWIIEGAIEAHGGRIVQGGKG